MIFPNPLYSAQTAIFPVIYIETGELIDRLKTLSVPAWFAISTADPAIITDMPKNINKGFGAQGLFVPMFGTVGNGAVFLWQARDVVQATRARLWFNTFRDSTWNNVWKQVALSDTPSA